MTPLARPWTRSIEGLRPIIEQMYDGLEERRDGAFEEGRDAVVALLKRDEAFDEGNGGDRYSSDFTEAVWELEAAVTEQDFDAALTDLYDWADDHRVWIDPTS